MNVMRDLGLEAMQSGTTNGENGWVECKEAKPLASIDPAWERPIAEVGLCGEKEYETLIEKSRQAFKAWRITPAPRRGEVIRRIADELRRHKEALGTLVSMETGKILQEGLGEVQEMIDMADFSLGLSRMLYGKSMHSERPSHRMFEQWHPLGPIGVISAFNFPVAVWSWNAFVAAVAGDTVIWKPSGKAPLSAVAVINICQRVLKHMGHPEIFSLYLPAEHAQAELLVRDPRVALISFTGSTQTGRHINCLVAERLGRTILELSGNNAVIVDESADLELATRSILFGAVGTAGQRCTTTRRVIAHQDILGELETRLKTAYARIRIGDPLNPETLMGPLIDAKTVQIFKVQVKRLIKEKARLIHGGKVIKGEGFYVEPTIFEVSKNSPLIQGECFAPILSLIKYQNLDEAIEIHNRVSHGLSSALFTTNLKHAERFLSVEGSDCGLANINIGTSGAEIGGAFGGEKDTGGGREAGSDAWKAYMRRQTNTINYSDELPLAQGVDFGIKDES